MNAVVEASSHAIDGIKRTFSTHSSCWLLSTLSIVVGVKLLTGSLDTNFLETLRAITHIANMQACGIIWIVFGVARMCALTSLGGNQVRWWASYFRAVFSGLTSVFWLQLSIGAIWAHPESLSAVVFPIFVLFDLFNTGDAASEAQIPWK